MLSLVPLRPSLTRWIAPAGALVAGAAAAGVAASLPRLRLEEWVWRTGLPNLVPAARPPLGDTARVLVAIGGGALAALIVWSALYLLFGQGGVFAGVDAAAAVESEDDDLPTIRRADAHPDAPPRRPFSAADLGPAESAAWWNRDPAAERALAIVGEPQDMAPAAAAEPVAAPDPVVAMLVERAPAVSVGTPTIGSLLERLESATRREGFSAA